MIELVALVFISCPGPEDLALQNHALEVKKSSELERRSWSEVKVTSERREEVPRPSPGERLRRSEVAGGKQMRERVKREAPTGRASGVAGGGKGVAVGRKKSRPRHRGVGSCPGPERPDLLGALVTFSLSALGGLGMWLSSRSLR